MKYWLRLCSMTEDRLILDALECNYQTHQLGIFTMTSIVINYILKTYGFNHIWEQKGTTMELLTRIAPWYHKYC